MFWVLGPSVFSVGNRPVKVLEKSNRHQWVYLLKLNLLLNAKLYLLTLKYPKTAEFANSTDPG